MIVSIDHDLDTEKFLLMVSDGRMAMMPAGPRLFRAAPHPNIQFSHDDP